MKEDPVIVFFPTGWREPLTFEFVRLAMKQNPGKRLEFRHPDGRVYDTVDTPETARQRVKDKVMEKGENESPDST